MKRSVLIIMLLIMIFALFGCSAGESYRDDTVDYVTSGDVSVNTGRIITFIEGENSLYNIIIPDKYIYEGVILDAAREFRSSVTESTGAKLEISSDWVKDESELENEEYRREILIGNTNRKESKEVLATLREKDYAIDIVGEKLVIIGGTEEKTAEAVRKFIQLYFSGVRESLLLDAGYRYQSRHSYDVTGLTIMDSTINDYRIVYGQNGESAASLLALFIKEYTGFSLEVLPESAEETDREIIVGDVLRNDSPAIPGEYIIAARGTRLFIKGKDSELTSYAVRVFKDEFLSGGENINVGASYAKSGSAEKGSSHSIMSLNVSLSGYGENSVPNRYPRLVSLVEKYIPDIICLQEVSSSTWYELITKGDSENSPLTDTYTFVGTGRNGESGSYDIHVEGAYNAILFKSDKYTLAESGTFWLSDTPDIPSIGWDGRTRAICTWAILSDKATNESFLVLNTQLDVYGKQSPKNGAKQISDFAAYHDLPTILCGDFGSKSAAGNVGAYFADSMNITESTQNDYGQSTGNTPTDYIFLSNGNTHAGERALIKDNFEEKYVSSHWALRVVVELYK